MTALNCPKCPGAMRRHALIGVEIDQCEQCSGIFLDRGELEQLLEAEHRWSRGLDPTDDGVGRRRRRPTESIAEVTHQGEQPEPDYAGQRRRESFLDEIFT
ncbi:TFIIB-type zinc ribbon-containing protein [Lipingzhangella rawalii]|nr:zf-TFIIB domain-containing protein [Lipingzhangella rawalii]